MSKKENVFSILNLSEEYETKKPLFDKPNNNGNKINESGCFGRTIFNNYNIKKTSWIFMTLLTINRDCVYSIDDDQSLTM